MMRTIKGYIFDLDHTLLNSDKIQIEAFIWAFQKHGLDRSYNAILEHFDMATDELARTLIGTDKADSDAIAQDQNRRIIEQVAEIPLIPGANDVLLKIHELGGKIAFASNNYKDFIEALIKTQHWDEISSGFVGIGDVKIGKPHPEMIQKAVKKLDLHPRDCVMIGDSSYDMIAAQDAKVHTVAVLTGTTPKTKFEELKIPLILPSVADLLFRLPLNQ